MKRNRKLLNISYLDHRLFWREHPALLLGLTLLTGTSSYLYSTWSSFGLWALYLFFLRSWSSFPLLGGAVLYAFCLYAPAPISPNTAYFAISSLQPHVSPFQKGLLYRGTLYTERQKLPLSVYIRGGERPLAHCDYLLKGKLQARSPYEYTFKPDLWVPVPNTWSLAEWRYQAKEKVRLFFNQKLPSPRVSTFLGSLVTGDVEERSLRYEFSRLGLSHILAISGFHFGVLIAFASFFLGLFLPTRWKLLLLLVAVNGYFLFVGSLPAVQRTWVAVQLYLLGQLIGRQASGLNLLGMALGIEVILDPLVASNIGFQLSFASCFGILLLNPFFESLLRPYLPKRNSVEIDALTLLSKHAYFLSVFFRKGISLTLSVNAAILPLLLYHFHEFPLFSLFYNLFFPFFVGVSLFLLLISLIVNCLSSFLASPLFALTNWLTSQLLDLTANPPVAIDYSLQVASLPHWFSPLWLFGLLLISIQRQKSRSLQFSL